ncbi:MAG: right-handed parallel beta-helix repeat-containing protein, partial [Chitinivibrionales bacterium]|nr:right-handed parallel beta-helix repeat-containing protein [Chitinivibrionales bacterium]
MVWTGAHCRHSLHGPIRIISFFCLFLYLFFSDSPAKITEFSGTVSPVHHLFSDTTVITAPVIVPSGSTLTIEPKSVMIFKGSHGITVHGRLIARGNSRDSILFLQPNSVFGWTGILFDSSNSPGDSSVLAYCRIEDGFSADGRGGAIIIRNYHSGLSIRNSLIRNCRSQPASGRGSGLYADSSANIAISDCRIEKNYGLEGTLFFRCCREVSIRNSIIRENSAIAGNGGGIYVLNSPLSVEGSILSGNTAQGFGGAISVLNGSLSITSSIMVNNQSVYGGALAFDRTSSTSQQESRIVNCIIDGNRATSDGAAVLVYNQNQKVLLLSTTIVRHQTTNYSSSISFYGKTTRLTNCIVWLNKGTLFNDTTIRTITYSAVQGGYTGEGNISLYPQFSDSGTGIWTLTAGSACINAGGMDTTGLALPATDCAGNPRIFDDYRIDMGAYEFMGTTPLKILRITPRFIDSTMGLNKRDTLLCTVFNRGKEILTIDSIRLTGSGAVGFVSPKTDNIPIGPSSSLPVALKIRAPVAGDYSDTLSVYADTMQRRIPIRLLLFGRIMTKGRLSGRLPKGDSPYLLTDTVTVDAGKSLTIDPGVTIYCANVGLLKVEGQLRAIGNASDSIRFSTLPSDTLNRQGGLLFSENGNDSSRIAYCRFLFDPTGLKQALINIKVHRYRNITIENSHVTCGKMVYLPAFDCLETAMQLKQVSINTAQACIINGIDADFSVTACSLKTKTPNWVINCIGGSPTFSGNFLETAHYGIQVLRSNISIERNVIIGTRAYGGKTDGGTHPQDTSLYSYAYAIICNDSKALIRANTIKSFGTAIACSDSSSVQCVSNYITGSVYYGITSDASAMLRITNCTFLNNQTALSFDSAALVEVTNTIFWSNSEDINGKPTRIHHSICNQPFEGEMIFNLDPQCEGDSFTLKNNSPCIDNGAADTANLALGAVDISGGQRFRNKRVDIGAWESRGTAVTFPILKTSPSSIALKTPIKQPVSATIILSNTGTGRCVIDSVRLEQGLFCHITKAPRPKTGITPGSADTVKLRIPADTSGIFEDILLLYTAEKTVEIPVTMICYPVRTLLKGPTISGRLTKASSPYGVSSELTVIKDSSLIIDPGVELLMLSSESQITTAGTLRARGTRTEPIKFYADTLLEDRWKGIVFTAASPAAAPCSLAWVTMYGVQNRALTIDRRTGFNISHTTIHSHEGIQVLNSSVSVDSCTIIKSWDDGYENFAVIIYDTLGTATPASSVRINGCSFKDFHYGISSFRERRQRADRQFYSENSANPISLTMSGSTISAQYYGLYLYNTQATIDRCTLSSGSGVGSGIYIDNEKNIPAPDKPTCITRSSIDGFSTGVNFTGGRVRKEYGVEVDAQSTGRDHLNVTTSSIHPLHNGIACHLASATIDSCTIIKPNTNGSNQRTGILINNSDAPANPSIPSSVLSTTLSGFTRAIVIAGGGAVSIRNRTDDSPDTADRRDRFILKHTKAESTINGVQCTNTLTTIDSCAILKTAGFFSDIGIQLTNDFSKINCLTSPSTVSVSTVSGFSNGIYCDTYGNRTPPADYLPDSTREYEVILRRLIIVAFVTSIESANTATLIENCTLTKEGEELSTTGLLVRNSTASPDKTPPVKIVNSSITNFATGIEYRLTNNQQLHIVGCVIAGNRNDGIAIGSNGFCIVTNSSLIGNGENGIGLYDRSDAVCRNSIIWGNRRMQLNRSGVMTRYCTIENGYDGIGNSNENPLFANLPAGDYSLSAHSPCIDNGDADTSGCRLPPLDLNGKERIFGKRVDCGAFEYQGSGTSNRLIVYPQRCDTSQSTSDSLRFVVTVFNSGIYAIHFDSAQISGNAGCEIIHTIPDQSMIPASTSDSIELRLKTPQLMHYQQFIRIYANGKIYTTTITINAKRTLITPGTVSGVWTRRNSPYSVWGTIKVAAGQKLRIEPGVTVEFLNRSRFNIEGTLAARGTADQPIIFTAEDTVRGWRGIHLKPGQDSCRDSTILVHCRIINCRNRLVSFNRQMWLSQSSINGSLNSDSYAALTIERRRLVRIDSCDISNNEMALYGGAIACIDSSTCLIRGNTLHNNSTCSGGALYCSAGSQVEFAANRVSNNSGYDNGGGLYFEKFSAGQIYDNIFYKNWAVYCGGGIYADSSSTLKIIRNRLCRNEANQSGGGVYSQGRIELINNCIDSNSTEGTSGGVMINAPGRDATLVNNTIVHNIRGGVNAISPTLVVNSILWNNHDQADIFHRLYGICSNSDSPLFGEENSCVAPLFLNTTNHPFMLKPASPCINTGFVDVGDLSLPATDCAGNPRIMWGRIDRGAYECNNTAPTLINPLGTYVRLEDSPDTTLCLLDTMFKDQEQKTLLYRADAISQPAPVQPLITSDGNLMLHCVQDASGLAQIKVSADDGFGGVAADTLTVTILPINDTPRIVKPIPPCTTTVGKIFQKRFYAIDPDSNELLTWNMVSGTPKTFVFDSINATLIWTPAPDQCGKHQFILGVVDRSGCRDTATVHCVALPSISIKKPLLSKASTGNFFAAPNPVTNASGSTFFYIRNVNMKPGKS